MRILGLAVVLAACTAGAPGEPQTERRSRKAVAPSVVVLNTELAREARVDTIRPGGNTGYGLTGAGVLVGQWDEGGARETHLDLFGRAKLADEAGPSEHATHVAGTLVGAGSADARALGIAPGARLLAHSLELDLIELGETASFVSVSNHAYGPALGWHRNPACPDVWSWTGHPGERRDERFGRYGRLAASVDRIVRGADLLSIWAAGNHREDGPTSSEPHAHSPSCDASFTDQHDAELELGHDTIGGAAVAKNVLTVGAVRRLPAAWDARDVVPLASSSFGPTDDGRVKPDVVAGGDGVLSLSARADDAYATAGGTSSAAAVVTGVAALLVEQYRAGRAGRDPRAAELKALLVQTAAGAGNPGPDYATGHGLIDARAAADFVDADSTAPRLRVDVATGSPNELTTDEVAEGTPLRVTLAWLDPAGPIREEGDDVIPVLENDLDLSLVAPDGRTLFYPWSLDAGRPDAAAARDAPNRVDNVEVVDVDASDNRWTGDWTVRVEAARPLSRGDAQPYAIAASVPLSAATRPIVGSATRLALELPPSGSPALSIPVDNLGGGELRWTASTDAPFLALERASGGAGDPLVVRAVASALGATDARATISLASNEPGAPRQLGVVLSTTCEPECGQRRCGVDPVCGALCGRCARDEGCSGNGSCEPLATSCPAADLGVALGSALVSGVTSGESRLFASCGGERAADSGFSWRAPRAGRYVFSTEGSAFDTILSVRRGGCGGTEITCNDDTVDLTSALVVELDEGESVSAVVDGFDGASGEYALGIHAVRCPDGELGSGLGAELVPEASPGRIDRIRSSCAAATAREVAFGFTAPVDGLYRFDASGSNYDATVAILRDDCGGEELGCGTDAIEVSLFAGARVIVVVDGALSHEARFALGITTRGLTCDGDCSGRPHGGLCACDERCVELGDCCVDACGDCANCAPEEACEFGRCVPRRCTGSACGCDSGTGGSGARGCDAGAGGEPSEGGAPSEEEPSRAVLPSGCSCGTAPASNAGALAWLGIALGACALASRKAKV